MQHPIFRWERNFTKQLFQLAVPIALQSVVTAAMQIVDNVMVGKLGEVPLAAVSQANRISFLFQLAMFGTISGASIFVSQYWGKRDVAGVRRTLGIATAMGLVVAALLGLPSIFFPGQLIRILIKSQEARRLGAEYLGIMGFVYFIQGQSLVQAAVLKSTEQVKLPMFASIAAILTNICFNWLLIYDHGSFGGYGVRGAAIATMIGAAVELGVLIVFARRFGFVTAAKLGELRPGSRKAVRDFLVIALPVLLNESLWAAGTVTYSAIYGRLGDGVTAAAAANIFSTIEQLASVAIRALSHACGVMIGMAIGAGDENCARLYAKRFLWETPLISQGVGLAILALSGSMVGFFNVTAETAAAARGLIRIFACFIWAHALNCVVIVAILRTGGDVRAAAAIDVIPLWLVGVPMAALAGLVFHWDVQRVYLMTYCEQIAKGALCLWRMRSGKWVHNLVANNQ